MPAYVFADAKVHVMSAVCLFVCKIRQKLQGSISLILLEQWKRNGNKSFFKIAREVKDKRKSLG